MIVCHCFKITEQQIKDCISDNLDPIKVTKASTACRGCRTEVVKIIKKFRIHLTVVSDDVT